MSIRNTQTYAFILGIVFTAAIVMGLVSINFFVKQKDTDQKVLNTACLEQNDSISEAVELLSTLIVNDGHGSDSAMIRKINTHISDGNLTLADYNVTRVDYERMSRNAYRDTAIENLDDFRRNVFPEKQRMEAYQVLQDIKASN